MEAFLIGGSELYEITFEVVEANLMTVSLIPKYSVLSLCQFGRLQGKINQFGVKIGSLHCLSITPSHC